MFINNRNKGVVLISVLLVILLLSTIAAFIGSKYFVAIKRFAYLEYQTHALNYYRGVESISIQRIKDELDANKQYLPRNHPLLNDSYIFDAANGSIKTDVKDLSNCININNLVKKNNGKYLPDQQNIKRIKKLLELLEYDEVNINEFTDQIIDWIDKDSDPRDYGIEDYYYTGPLSSPMHYSGMRYFNNIDELKALPITKIVQWDHILKYLCALPISEQGYININSMNMKDAPLLASAFSELSLFDAEYIIFNMLEEGYDQNTRFYNSFNNIEFGEPYVEINFTSNKFMLISELKSNNFNSSSLTTIYYGKNRNGEILLRTYNGI
jgi:general secretion pathway protein K